MSQSVTGNGVDKMAIYKRGSIYWYKFKFNGEAIRESTRQKNQHKAKDMESTHRSRLAMGEVGIREKKVIPTLKSFCVDRVPASHPERHSGDGESRLDQRQDQW